MQTLTVDGLHVANAIPDRPKPGRPPLLLVHGSQHGAWCWEHWLRELPKLGWEAWALSLRNHPGSRAVDLETYCRRTTVWDYVADVRAVANHIGRPVVLVGHSMGGRIVQHYPYQEPPPDRVAGLVLVTCNLLTHGGSGREVPYPTERPHLMTPEDAVNRYFHGLPPTEALGWMGKLVGESPAVLNAGPDRAFEPGRVRCPVLSVTAEHDHPAMPRDGRVARFYNADHIHAEGIGHDLMLDAGWERVLARVMAWLAERFG
jgi:hypothetical protein